MEETKIKKLIKKRAFVILCKLLELQSIHNDSGLNILSLKRTIEDLAIIAYDD